MRMTRLYLRNYRVYQQELDLQIPAGLVGIYGPNGSGKSALVESIRWTLFGKSRTSNDQIRTSEINEDCITEVEFEHEGHLYLVRRTITGIKRVSKPGLRVYSKADSVGRVLGGMGVAILSTNQGLLTDREAREHADQADLQVRPQLAAQQRLLEGERHRIGQHRYRPLLCWRRRIFRAGREQLHRKRRHDQ